MNILKFIFIIMYCAWNNLFYDNTIIYDNLFYHNIEVFLKKRKQFSEAKENLLIFKSFKGSLLFSENLLLFNFWNISESYFDDINNLIFKIIFPLLNCLGLVCLFFILLLLLYLKEFSWTPGISVSLY